MVDWKVDVCVEYNQPLKENELVEMLSSLLLFNKNASTVRPRALAARELGQEVRQTRSATAGTEKCDDDDDDEENKDRRAPDPQDIPEGERRHCYIHGFLCIEELAPVYEKDGKRWWNEYADMDLLYFYPMYVSEFFTIAMKELAGDTWAEKIVLVLDIGGDMGCGLADEGAEIVSFRLVYKPLTTRIGRYIPVSGGEVNAPWGVSTTIIPRLDAAEEDAVRAHFKLVCKYFKGFEALDEPALRLVTVAGGHGN